MRFIFKVEVPGEPAPVALALDFRNGGWTAPIQEAGSAGARETTSESWQEQVWRILERVSEAAQARSRDSWTSAEGVVAEDFLAVLERDLGEAFDAACIRGFHRVKRRLSGAQGSRRSELRVEGSLGAAGVEAWGRGDGAEDTSMMDAKCIEGSADCASLVSGDRHRSSACHESRRAPDEGAAEGRRESSRATAEIRDPGLDAQQRLELDRRRRSTQQFDEVIEGIVEGFGAQRAAIGVECAQRAARAVWTVVDKHERATDSDSSSRSGDSR